MHTGRYVLVGKSESKFVAPCKNMGSAPPMPFCPLQTVLFVEPSFRCRVRWVLIVLQSRSRMRARRASGLGIAFRSAASMRTSVVQDSSNCKSFTCSMEMPKYRPPAFTSTPFSYSVKKILEAVLEFVTCSPACGVHPAMVPLVFF